MDLQLLDNIVWHTLNGAHAQYASGTAVARRYARGFSPILAFAEAQRPDFAALDPFCADGEHFYCGGWTGAVPAGWTLDADSAAHQMLWTGATPDADDDFIAVKLASQHVPQMLALVAIEPPGPFAARTIELGDYFGVFDAERLVAMAGERMVAGSLREISGVCTHPDFQGRGHARRLVALLIRRQLARGETPFLHVMRDNVHACRIYERTGFAHHQEMPVRVLTRVG